MILRALSFHTLFLKPSLFSYSSDSYDKILCSLASFESRILSSIVNWDCFNLKLLRKLSSSIFNSGLLPGRMELPKFYGLYNGSSFRKCPDINIIIYNLYLDYNNTNHLILNILL